MAKQKHLVVSAEKSNRGCYDIHGWTYKRGRGEYDLNGVPVRVITQQTYLKDFGEWDLPISEEHMKSMIKYKKDEIDL